LTCTNFNFGCVFYEQITPQSVSMLIVFYVWNVTPKFISTGRAILYTILIDRSDVYSTRAAGLYTNSQTDCYVVKNNICAWFLGSYMAPVGEIIDLNVKSSNRSVVKGMVS